MRGTPKLGALLGVAMLLLTPHELGAQEALKGALASVTGLDCRFSLMVVGGWDEGQPGVETRESDLVLEFIAINADEGTAQLASGFGNYDIIVRYAEPYLHFIQSFLDGPLYSTTVIENETVDGKLKATHSRHEFTEFALPGFTSRPEQYYGECTMVE